MIDITITVSEKEYPFFMELVKKLDFVTVKNQNKRKKVKNGAEIVSELERDRSGEVFSPSLEGPPMTETEFKNWVEKAEATPTITLQQAKNKWAEKRHKLQKLIK